MRRARGPVDANVAFFRWAVARIFAAHGPGVMPPEIVALPVPQYNRFMAAANLGTAAQVRAAANDPIIVAALRACLLRLGAIPPPPAPPPAPPAPAPPAVPPIAPAYAVPVNAAAFPPPVPAADHYNFGTDANILRQMLKLRLVTMARGHLTDLDFQDVWDGQGSAFPVRDPGIISVNLTRFASVWTNYVRFNIQPANWNRAVTFLRYIRAMCTIDPATAQAMRVPCFYIPNWNVMPYQLEIPVFDFAVDLSHGAALGPDFSSGRYAVKEHVLLYVLWYLTHLAPNMLHTILLKIELVTVRHHAAPHAILGGNYYRNCGQVFWRVPSAAPWAGGRGIKSLFAQIFTEMRALFFQTGDLHGAAPGIPADGWEVGSNRVFQFVGNLWGNDPNAKIILNLYDNQFHPYQMGGKWYDDYEKYLNFYFPEGGFLTVKNVDDDLCFLYMVCLALARLEDPSFLINEGNRFLDVWTLFCRIRYGSHCKAAQEMIERSQMPSGSRRFKFEQRMSEMYDLQGFVKVMQEAEDEVVPEGFALDVTVLEVGNTFLKPTSTKPRLYPVYNSRREGQRIHLMMIMPRDDTCHFCLVTDNEKVFRSTGNKMFQVCSHCHQSFFTQKMIDLHKCKGKVAAQKAKAAKKRKGKPMSAIDEDEELLEEQRCGDDDDFHWNSVGYHDASELVGCCHKCKLMFSSEYDYAFHQEHCMMKNRRGYRHITLPPMPCLLTGIDGKEADEKRTLVDRVFYADFESYIRTSDGEHCFMSFGLYDAEADDFVIGFSIEEFMDKLVERCHDCKHAKVYFHNAMGYDANFILRHVLNSEKCTRWGVRVLMKTTTKLQRLSFMYREGKDRHILEIGDTFAFMTMSLDGIVKSVKAPTVEENMAVFPRFFREFHDKYPHLSAGDVALILKKNLFPYRFFDSATRLDTPIAEFKRIFEPAEENLQYFSETVTVDDLRANLPEFLHICELFGCRDARDYHNIYLMCDVLQIADVFEAAVEACEETHHICLHNYMGMPGATWDAFLRHNPSLVLPLYKNTIFAEAVKDATRGGPCQVGGKRHFKRTPKKDALYLDVNGLYPDRMRNCKFPCGDLIWVDFQSEQKSRSPRPKYNIDKDPQKFLMEEYFPYLREHNKGCLVWCDLHLTKELKERTDQYPFAHEHRMIYDEYFDAATGDLSGVYAKWSEANEGARMAPFMGLVGTLYDKKKYGSLWHLLEWYIKHGMKVTRLYYAIEFDERDYLSSYAGLNIDLRNQYTDALHKMFLKLLGNALYGKTFEDTMNRILAVICRNQYELRGVIEHDEPLAISPIDDENCVVKLDGDVVCLDKPTYIGACVTEYAKLLMYEIFYDKLPRLFPEGYELLYTDTDSFIVEVTHPEGWTPKDIFDHIRRVDPDFLGSKGGQLKSETGEDDLIEEGVFLRAKVYAYKTIKGNICKHAKGVHQSAQETQLQWESFLECLFTMRSIPVTMPQIRRTGFKLTSELLQKTALGWADGKRKLCEDGIHTHAMGYDDENKLEWYGDPTHIPDWWHNLVCDEMQ